MMNILITGKNGFIARNLSLRINSLDYLKVFEWSISEGYSKLRELLDKADIIVHLASAIKAADEGFVFQQNENLTIEIEKHLSSISSPKKLIFASSTKLDQTEYGRSKIWSEKVFMELSKKTKVECVCVRIPGVFGKFSRPNHNSVVSTFCYNAVKGRELKVHEYNKLLQLVYIDQIVDIFCNLIENSHGSFVHVVDHCYEVSIGKLKEKILKFSELSKHDKLPFFKTDFDKELYSTYKWFEDSRVPDTMVSHKDPRGVFAELLKLEGSGQISFCTIEVGKSRGNHYHHTKWERFFILDGVVQFVFRDLVTGETNKVVINANNERIQAIDSTPGIVHSLENIGDCKVSLVVWANEIFDRNRPDTYEYGNI